MQLRDGDLWPVIEEMFKPFRPLSLLKPTADNASSSSPEGPPQKKRRITEEPLQHPEHDPPDVDTSSSQGQASITARPNSLLSSLPRKPLIQVTRQPASIGSEALKDNHEAYYNVVW